MLKFTFFGDNILIGLQVSTEDMKLGTTIQFSCTNGNRLGKSYNLISKLLVN